MTDAPIFPLRAAPMVALGALLALPFWFASCSSTKNNGLPEKLPDIALAGSTATPAHHMATYEYPFDSAGNYVGDWAAEGEHRAGRSARATNDDEKKWSGSHGGSASGPSRGKKTTKGKPKPASTDDDPPPKKKSSSAAAKSKSGGGSKYVVKKGDTVERIARRYGISASRLKSANGLKSDLIRDGQTLKIPQ